MSGSVSKISRIRAADVIASWDIARMTPSDATGQTSESSSVMKATSSPGVRAPRPTPIAPSSSTTTTARFGITSRKLQNRAESRTLSMLVACSFRAARSYCSATCSLRPKDLITRMPTAPSSDSVARSPCSSCTRRETTTYVFSKRIESHTIGAAAAATTSPSGQYMFSSTIVTTVTWRTLITRNSSPKPLNRRIAERSVVARESSCPDCHLLWKLIGSSWSRA